MRRFTICTVAALAAASLTAAIVTHAAASAKAEADAVRAAVQLYIDGVGNGDTAKLEQAFHADWRMTGFMADDSFVAMSRAEVIEMIGGMGKPPEGRFAARVVDVQHHGRAAVACVDMRLGQVRFTDYLSLLKLDGRWVIVNKIWETEVVSE